MSDEIFSIKTVESDKKKISFYEELLLRRDQLLKKAESYLIDFTREFGDMINENFKLTVECIKIKKTISYCRRRLNRGLPIDTNLMQSEIDAEMALYYDQLNEMISDTEAARKAHTISAYRLQQAKKIYRRLIKMLHPDINRMTGENELLSELWEKVVDAYHRTDVDDLEDLEVLVKKALEDLGDEGFEIQLADIDARIERIEDKINEIITSKPYIYGELLADDEKIKSYRDELQAEHDDTAQYLDTLKSALDEMLCEGGARIIWKTN